MSAKKTARDCSKGTQKNKKVSDDEVRVFTRELITGPAGAKAAAETASAATIAERSIVQMDRRMASFAQNLYRDFCTNLLFSD
jgi:hypothetical protein